MWSMEKTRLISDAGRVAEDLFMAACSNLGFRIVEDTHPLVPATVRRATPREDANKVDFVLTPSRDSRGRALPVVEIQLTFVTKPKTAKRRVVRDRGIAWVKPIPLGTMNIENEPVTKADSREYSWRNRVKWMYFMLLAYAANGDEVALEYFGEILMSIICKNTGRESEDIHLPDSPAHLSVNQHWGWSWTNFRYPKRLKALMPARANRMLGEVLQNRKKSGKRSTRDQIETVFRELSFADLLREQRAI